MLSLSNLPPKTLVLSLSPQKYLGHSCLQDTFVYERETGGKAKESERSELAGDFGIGSRRSMDPSVRIRSQCGREREIEIDRDRGRAAADWP